MNVLSVGLSAGTIAITFEGYGRLLGERFAFAVPIADLVLKVPLTLILPVLGGMSLRYFWPQFAADRKRWIRRAGLVDVAFLLAYGLIAECAAVVGEWGQTALARAVFMRLAFMGRVGFNLVLRLAPSYRLAFDIGFAVRSASLAMVIAIAILHRIEYDVFATVYLRTEILLLFGVAAMHWRREWMSGKAWVRQVSQ